MATNAASYNPSKCSLVSIHTECFLRGAALVGEETGTVSGNPPPLSNETKGAVADAAKSSATGSHVPGQDAGSKVGTAGACEGEKKVKTEKECMDAL